MGRKLAESPPPSQPRRPRAHTRRPARPPGGLGKTAPRTARGAKAGSGAHFPRRGPQGPEKGIPSEWERVPGWSPCSLRGRAARGGIVCGPGSSAMPRWSRLPPARGPRSWQPKWLLHGLSSPHPGGAQALFRACCVHIGAEREQGHEHQGCELCL